MQKAFHLNIAGVYIKPDPNQHFQMKLVDETVPALMKALIKQSSTQQRDKEVCRDHNPSMGIRALLCSVDVGASGNSGHAASFLGSSPTNVWGYLPTMCLNTS